jgi:Spy/CpxP family protein refolding chaperone
MRSKYLRECYRTYDEETERGKKMKKTMIVMMIIVLLIGVLAFAAMAYGRRAGTGWMGHGVYYNDTLNLTPEQEEKLLTIHQDFQKDTQTLRFDWQKKNLELRQLWATKPLKQEAIDAKAKEVAAIQVKMTAKIQEMQDKIKGVLTVEQLKQWNTNSFRYGPGVMGHGWCGGHGCMGMGCSY